FVVRGDGVIFGKDNRVFRIDPDGKLTTVSPWMSGPPIINGEGTMAFGSDGMLYTVDWTDQTVVRIDVDHGGAITAIAGKKGMSGYADGVGSAALFNGVDSVAADGNKIYVTEANNDAVRAIDPATGTVTTLAGGGGCGYVDMPGTQARFCGLNGIVS